MGLWDRLTGEIIDVIEWLDRSDDTMVYRYERYGNEIKYGAMLTVREGQRAVFVNEGEVADVFEPGMYELHTGNLPIVSTLQSWKHGFQSPFKAEVYFFNTKRFTDLKWGTKNPIMLRDRDFGPVRLRAFGTYEVRVADPVVFLREIVGTDGDVQTDEISAQLRNLIVARFASVLGSSNIPILDLAANYEKLSDFITTRIAPEVGEYGLELTRMLVENISLPKSVEEAMDRRSSMGVIGDLDAYTKFQAAESMRTAAANPGGAGAGMGMGMGAGLGMAMATQLAGASQQTASRGAPAMPPPMPASPQIFVAVNGQQSGPYSQDAVSAMVSKSQLGASTLVWMAGMSNWEPAGQIALLSGLFAPQMPPPLN